MINTALSCTLIYIDLHMVLYFGCSKISRYVHSTLDNIWRCSATTEIDKSSDITPIMVAAISMDNLSIDFFLSDQYLLQLILNEQVLLGRHLLVIIFIELVIGRNANNAAMMVKIMW